MVAITFLLQMVAIYLPALQTFLKTNPLLWSDLLLCIAVSSLVFVLAEVEKWWASKK